MNIISNLSNLSGFVQQVLMEKWSFQSNGKPSTFVQLLFFDRFRTSNGAIINSGSIILNIINSLVIIF